MDEHERGKVIAAADQCKNSNPPPFFCATCCNTGRVGMTRENMEATIEGILDEVREMESGEPRERRLYRALEMWVEWNDDRCVECGDCRG